MVEGCEWTVMRLKWRVCRCWCGSEVEGGVMGTTIQIRDTWRYPDISQEVHRWDGQRIATTRQRRKKRGGKARGKGEEGVLREHTLTTSRMYLEHYTDVSKKDNR